MPVNLRRILQRTEAHSCQVQFSGVSFFGIRDPQLARAQTRPSIACATSIPIPRRVRVKDKVTCVSMNCTKSRESGNTHATVSALGVFARDLVGAGVGWERRIAINGHNHGVGSLFRGIRRSKRSPTVSPTSATVFHSASLSECSGVSRSAWPLRPAPVLSGTLAERQSR
jgi:hypothetical protein